MRNVIVYRSKDGAEPYSKWLDSIADLKTRARIENRVDRLNLGNFGDHRGVGEGVQELRLHFGPGYRVYFAEDGSTLVLLLMGGDKRTQRRDIEQAKDLWRDYKERK